MQIGKERRDALVRGKRLRRGEANDDGDDEDVAMDEDAASRVLEEKVLVAVQELEAAGKQMYCP